MWALLAELSVRQSQSEDRARDPVFLVLRPRLEARGTCSDSAEARCARLQPRPHSVVARGQGSELLAPCLFPAPTPGGRVVEAVARKPRPCSGFGGWAVAGSNRRPPACKATRGCRRCLTEGVRCLCSAVSDASLLLRNLDAGAPLGTLGRCVGAEISVIRGVS